MAEASHKYNNPKTGGRFEGVAVFGSLKAPCVLLEVADTPAKKIHGLMGRKWLPDCCGMLFTGLTGGYFWMKGCNIPLDVMFLDNSMAVSRIYSMEADGGIKRYGYGDEEAAIEVPYGFCSRYGISVGTKVAVRLW